MTRDHDENPNAKHVWRKFNFTEWMADPLLKSVSREARSFWLDLCGLIYQAEDFGRLSIRGEPPTIRQLADILGDDIRVVKRLTDELEKAGVFDRTPEGFIQSRRILREEVRRTSGRSFGKLGGNPALKTEAYPPQTLNAIARNQSPDRALARERVISVCGPGIRDPRQNPDVAATLDLQLEPWLRQYDLEQDIVPVIRSKTAKPRPDQIGTFSWFTRPLEEFHRKRVSGLPFGPVPSKAPSAAVDVIPQLPSKAKAGAAAHAILKAKGQAWYAAWLLEAEWNGTDVQVHSEFAQSTIDREVGHILKAHEYTVTVKRVGRPSDGVA